MLEVLTYTPYELVASAKNMPKVYSNIFTKYVSAGTNSLSTHKSLSCLLFSGNVLLFFTISPRDFELTPFVVFLFKHVVLA